VRYSSKDFHAVMPMQKNISPIAIFPLGIAVDGPGKYRIVNTVAGLADLLVNHWPFREKKEAWRSALATCLQAFEGKSSGDDARKVFIHAAQDAELPLILAPPPTETGGQNAAEPEATASQATRAFPSSGTIHQISVEAYVSDLQLAGNEALNAIVGKKSSRPPHESAYRLYNALD
jgi:hypothetical protein